MRKYRRIRRFTVLVKILSNHSRNSHRDPNEAVLVNTSPNDIEPSQSAPRCSPRSSLSSTTSREPVDRQDPFLRCNASEIHLLFVEIWRDVVAEEREERGNGECFVAVGYDLEIDRMPVVPEGEERGRGINWYHEQDSYDTRKGQHRDRHSEVWERTVFAHTAWYNGSHASILDRKTVE